MGRPETGVFQKLQYDKETEGAFATISGFFSEKLLDFGSYRKTQVINASSAAAVKAGITTYIGNANAAVVVDGKSYKPLKSVVILSLIHILLAKPWSVWEMVMKQIHM